MNINESNVRATRVLKDDKLFKSKIMRVWRDRLKIGFGFDVWKLPVCEKCEGWALWDEGGRGTCTKCGHTTKNPITVERYYENDYNVDRTVNRDAPRFADRGFYSKVATVYGGEAGLNNEHKKIIVPEGRFH